VNKTLELLLSSVYPGALAPAHQADLDQSGLSPATIALHKIRSVPPGMISHLLGFSAPKTVTSAYVIPFPDPYGGWLDHVRLKVFPPYRDRRKQLVKYLGPRGAPPRLFFCLATLPVVLHGHAPVWLVEGSKKGLAVAQLGLPAVAIEGIENWHVHDSRALLPDFAAIPLRDRDVELLPDGDWQTNPHVERGVQRLAAALLAAGARPRLVVLPPSIEAAA
jgi:Domain of unknown function (DUF3854)